MKDYLVIILATALGFAAGAASMWGIMKDSKKESKKIHVQSQQNPTQSTFPTTDPEKHSANKTTEITSVSFEKLSYDFGTITEGSSVKTVFSFKNTGTKPLVISNCNGSCGCTVPVCPEQAIPPGQKGKIEVEFNSTGKNGKQNKSVSVNANTEPPVTFIEITADVKPRK